MSGSESRESTVHGDTRFGPTTFVVRRDNPFRSCSYCGSIHPEDLVTLRDTGQILSVDRSVDWKYGWPHKVYVHVRDPREGELTVRGMTTEPRGDYRGWDDLTDAERAAVEEDEWYRDRKTGGFIFGPRREIFGKFYNVHQAEPWVTDELRQEVAEITGYLITDAGGGRIRWQAFDYRNGAGA